MTISAQSSDLDRRIVSLVQQCWEEHRMPLLLSRLGGQDDGRIAKLARQQAGGLGAYLRRQLPDLVRVIQHSTKPPVIGAIPAEEAEAGTNGNFDALLERAQGHPSQPAVEAAPLYHPAFWAAFRKPLDESNRRYMSIRAPLRFLDAILEDEPDGFVEIKRKYVVGPDAEAAEVQKKAGDWLAANNQDPMLFLSKRKVGDVRLPSDDLLGRLLLALEPDELKRMSMPLDIVNKLRREPL